MVFVRTVLEPCLEGGRALGSARVVLAAANSPV